MKFHPTQALVAKDRHKYRVVCCGRQWGKTTLSVWEMWGCAYYKSGRRVGYFAPTFIQARDIAWKMLKEITAPFWSKEPNETRLEIFIKAKDGGESEIVLKGWESIESVRGTQFDFVVLDEVAKMRNFKEGYEAALMGSLVKRNADVLFISTPYGYNHFFELYEKEKVSEQYKSFHFSSYDNPYLEGKILDNIKATSTTDFFSQEYLAQFTRFTGLIYKELDISRHVHEFEHTKNENADYYFGLDFAVRGYTACMIGKVKSDGHIYLLDEYKKDSETAQNHAEAIKLRLTEAADLSHFTGYADPAGFAKNQQKGELIWAIADEYLEAGLPIVHANNEVTAGINFVRQLFKNDKIHIHPRCQMLLDELQQYQWKDQPDARKGLYSEPEEPRKINDHLADAMRYLCYSKPEASEELEVKRPTIFPLKFPEPRIDKPDDNSDEITEIDIPGFLE